MSNTIVTPEWLAAHLGEPNLVIADCRFTLGKPDAGLQAYRQGHIPGAVYFDLDRDLAGPAGEHGGRHPLPDPDVFAARLGAAGIGDGVTVVAYDDPTDMCAAARLWWMLRYFGHDQVLLLDGGFPAWAAQGRPVTAEVSTPTPCTFTPHLRPQMLASMADVRERSAGAVLVDSRAADRYQGAPNPLDARPGHIPGAVNYFWKDSMRPDGTYKPAQEQQQRLQDVIGAPDLILSCGSGVSACANLVALELAGVKGAKLYVGSSSDWASYPENRVDTGDK